MTAQQQIAELIARLTSARSDDEREAILQRLEQQPRALVLAELEAARAKATADARWWIDAAIQQIVPQQNR